MSPLAAYFFGLFTPVLVAAAVLAVLWPIDIVRRWYLRRTLPPHPWGGDFFVQDGRPVHIHQPFVRYDSFGHRISKQKSKN